MYEISNRQYSEVIEILTAYASLDRRGADLRTQNRCRRARLLVRALSRRMPSDKKSINPNKNK